MLVLIVSTVNESKGETVRGGPFNILGEGLSFYNVIKKKNGPRNPEKISINSILGHKTKRKIYFAS